jgi:hypothetical protein
MSKVPDFVREAATVAARRYGVDTDALFSGGRQSRPVTHARVAACKILRERVDGCGTPLHTFGQIADWFGVNRASVYRGLK